MAKTIFYEVLGYNEKETAIRSYETSGNINAAIMLAKFTAEDKPHLQQVIIHRDRDVYEKGDYQISEPRKKIQKLNDSSSTTNFHFFVTEGYDMESYFINVEHVKALCPKLAKTRISDLIDTATDDCEEKSLEKLYERLSEAKQGFRKKMKALEAKYYDNKPRYRYGKGVTKKLSSLLQQELGENVKLAQKSSAIQIPELMEIREKIWGA